MTLTSLHIPAARTIGVLADSGASIERGTSVFRNPFLFLAAWILAIVLGTCYAFHANRHGEDYPQAKFFFRAMFGVIFFSFLSVALSMFSLGSGGQSDLSTLFHDPHQTVVISRSKTEAQGVTLPRTAVTELAAIIDNSDSVLSHHSAPHNLYYIHFVEAGYVYRMSADSDNPDEYWIHWISYPGFDKKYEISQIYQIHSEELTNWNSEYVDNALSRDAQPK